VSSVNNALTRVKARIYVRCSNVTEPTLLTMMMLVRHRYPDIPAAGSPPAVLIANFQLAHLPRARFRS
jgi:hypothetical protein